MKRTALVGAILAALAPSLSFADMNYTNLEVSMVDVELGSGPFDVDGDGFELAGSFEITDKVFLFGEWQEQSLDFSIDGRTLEVGAGLTHGFSDKLDFVGTLSLVDSEIELGGSSADDDGLALGAGVRGRVNDSVELEGGLKYVDYDESGGDTGFTFGGRYYFNQSMALGASADFADNADTLRLGFRWEF
jgi:hypothetical protein